MHHDQQNQTAYGRAQCVPTLFAFDNAVASLPFHFYAGPLGAVAGRLEAHERNTDGRPWVEWSAPRSERARRAGEARAFVGAALARFQREIHDGTPPVRDPFLGAVAPEQRRYGAMRPG